MRVLYDSIFVCSIKTTCDKEGEDFREKDIIEFGGCSLNVQTLQTSNPFSLVLRPNKSISDYCTQKTGLTPEDASSGVSFVDLLDYLREVFGDTKGKPWASYGTFAKHMLRKHCEDEKVSFPFSDRFFNVKSWMPLIYNLDQEVSLKEALRTMSLPIPKGRDSRDDAINTAIVLKELLRGPNALEGNFVTCEIKRKKKEFSKKW